MMKRLFGMALVMCLAVSGMATAETIDDIQYYNPETGAPESPYDGQTVTVEGTVYCPKGIYNGGTFYIQGATGGISFYSSSVNADLGDIVEVTGTVSSYGGEIQLASPSVSVTGNGPVPDPAVMTSAEALADYENVGTFVSVTGIVTVVNSSNFYLDGDIEGVGGIQVYIDSTTGIDLGAVAVGDEYMVTAPCVVYNGEIELKPRYQADLVEDPSGDTVPVIANVNCVNWVPMASDPITVVADITDNSAIASASLYYRDSNGESNEAFSSVAMSAGPGNSYSGVIPAGHTMDQVDFYVSATDDGAQTVFSPGDAPVGFISVAVGFTTIYEMNYVHPDSADQDSRINQKIINITGVVTAGTGEAGAMSKFQMQEMNVQDANGMNPGTRMHGGCLIYEGSAMYEYYRGDIVEVGGKVNEYYGLTQMIPHNGLAINLVDFGDYLPAVRVPNHILSDNTLEDGDGIYGEAYESVWVKSYNCVVSEGDNGYGAFKLNDKAAIGDTLIVDPIVELAYVATLGDALTVEGFMTYSFSQYRMVPLSDDYIIFTEATPADDTPVIVGVGGFKSIAPNPFNPQTKINFVVAKDNLVQLNIYNIRGEIVRTLVQGTLPASDYSFNWDGTSNNGETVASGAYFARLRIGAELMQVRKLTMLK